MNRLTSKSDKQTFIKAILTGDKQTVDRYTNYRLIPPGWEPPLFWNRDKAGNYVAGSYCLTPDEFNQLREKYPCFPSDEPRM